MKKSFILAIFLMLSMFMFVGCGGDNATSLEKKTFCSDTYYVYFESNNKLIVAHINESEYLPSEGMPIYVETNENGFMYDKMFKYFFACYYDKETKNLHLGTDYFYTNTDYYDIFSECENVFNVDLNKITEDDKEKFLISADVLTKTELSLEEWREDKSKQ